MESTQDRIVTAALRLFGERGFRGTTTAEIARTAGVAEGTIYRYFKDKKELLIACVEPVIREAIRRETSVKHGESPREILYRRIVERMRVIRENLDAFNVLFMEGKHHPELAEILIKQVSDSIPPEEWQMISEAMQTGALRRPLNPLIMNVGLTAAMWAMISVGPAADRLFADWPTPVRYANLEQELAELVCTALMGDRE